MNFVALYLFCTSAALATCNKHASTCHQREDLLCSQHTNTVLRERVFAKPEVALLTPLPLPSAITAKQINSCHGGFSTPMWGRWGREGLCGGFGGDLRGPFTVKKWPLFDENVLQHKIIPKGPSSTLKKQSGE